MANDNYLDGKITGIVPYREVPNGIIEINEKQYLITPEQKKALTEYDQKITDLERRSLKESSVKIAKDFGSGAVAGFGLGSFPVALMGACSDFLQLKDSAHYPLMTWGLSLLAVLCFSTGISHGIGRYLSRKNIRQQELIEIKNKRQNLLEELVK